MMMHSSFVQPNRLAVVSTEILNLHLWKDDISTETEIWIWKKKKNQTVCL